MAARSGAVLQVSPNPVKWGEVLTLDYWDWARTEKPWGHVSVYGPDYDPGLDLEAYPRLWAGEDTVTIGATPSQMTPQEGHGIAELGYFDRRGRFRVMDSVEFDVVV